MKQQRPALASVKIADFTGAKDGESVDTWLKRIERVLRQGKTPKAEWEGFVACRLGMMASDWYESLDSGPRSYQQFRKMMIVTFQMEGTSTYAEALRSINKVKMDKRGVLEFWIRLEQALSQLRRYTKVDEVAAVQHFINGLSGVAAYHKRALDYQLIGQAETVDAIYKKMLALERLYREHPEENPGRKPGFNAFPQGGVPKGGSEQQQPGQKRTMEQMLVKISSQLGNMRKNQDQLRRDVDGLKNPNRRNEK